MLTICGFSYVFVKNYSTPETVLVIPRALRLTVSGKDVQGKELPEFR